jgi:drug/metabolite transporter (DMT)-like permease
MGAENPSLNAATVNLWRGLSTALFNMIIIIAKNKSLEFRCRSDFQLLNWRGFFCVLHGFMLALALTYLPPPVVHTINASGPVMVFIVDYFRNGIAVGLRQLVGIFIACIGLVITINAAMIMQWMGYDYEAHSKFDYVASSAQAKTVVSALLLICQLLWAYAMVLTKEIKTQDAYQIGFHLGLMQIFTGAFAGIWLGYPTISVVDETMMFLKVSIPLGIASVLMTLSLTMTKKTGSLTIVTFGNVLTGYLISVFRYG